MKVSYLIVAFKSNGTIGNSIRSILSQRGSFDKEIIVIDNFAADGCGSFVKQLAPAAELNVNGANLGYTHANNQALRASTGDYCFFLNPDVELEEKCTETLLNAISDQESAVAAAPQLTLPDGSIQKSVRNFPKFSTLIYEHTGLAALFRRSSIFGHWKNYYFDYGIRSFVNQPMASALLIKRKAIESIGEWDERFFVFFSDVDYCKRIIEAGSQIVFEPVAKAIHLGGSSTKQEGGWLVRDSHRGFYRYLVKYELKGVKVLLRPLAAALLAVSSVIRTVLRKLL